MRPSILVLLIVSALYESARGYELDLVFQSKCVMEYVDAEERISGHFEAYDKHNIHTPVEIDFKMYAPVNNELVHQSLHSSDGDFEVVNAVGGDYKLCFSVPSFQIAQNTRIKLFFRLGVAAHEWKTVAKKENLNSLQEEVLDLELAVQDIYLELQRIRRKEEEMRDINESTNARVAWLAVGALVTCLGLSAWQLLYLQRFFKRKKLL